jgi:hypothetical protein
MAPGEFWTKRRNAEGDLIMRAATVLVGFLLLSGSAYAADAQMKQPGKLSLAAAVERQIPAAPARSAKASIARRVSVPKTDEGDSRLNDYRLEREGCCGPQ